MKYPGCENCPRFHNPGPFFRDAKNFDLNPFVVITSVPPASGEQSIITGKMLSAGCRDFTIMPLVRCQGSEESFEEAKKFCGELAKEQLNGKEKRVLLASDAATKYFLDNFSTYNPHYAPSASSRTRTIKPVAPSFRYGCPEWRYGNVFLPFPEPYALMKNPLWKFQSNVWIKKFTQLRVVAPSFSMELEPSDAQVRDYAQEILQTKKFAADVETVLVGENNSLIEETEDEDDKRIIDTNNYQLTMLGVGAKHCEALVMLPRQVPYIKAAYTNREVTRYEHNGTYDRYFIEPYFPQRMNKVHDCIISFHLIYNVCRKALKPHGISMFTMLPYHNHDLAYQVSMKFYNACDIFVTFAEGCALDIKLQTEGLEDLFYQIAMPLSYELESWREEGLNIDLRKAEKFRNVIQSKMNWALEKFGKITLGQYSISSPIQLKEFFYEVLGLPEQKGIKGKDRDKVTFDFEARKRLLWKIDQELKTTQDPDTRNKLILAKGGITAINLYTGEKQKLQYLDRIDSDGKIHPTFKPFGQDFFRLASKPSVQNWPTSDLDNWGGARNVDQSGRPIAKSETPLGSLRSLVIPDNPEEDLLVSVDFCQAQLFIYAAIFNVKWIQEIKKRREYIYGWVYEKLYGPFWPEGAPREKIYKLPTVSKEGLRIAKAVPLGFIFNRGAEAVAIEQGWTLQQANELRDWWFSLCPELLKSYEYIENILASGRIKHAFNQICHFPTYKKAEAINSFAQSNEAMIMWKCIVDIAKKYQDFPPYYRTVLGVHDSLTFNVSQGKLYPERVKTLMEEIVTPAMTQDFPQLNNLSLDIEAEVGDMWDYKMENYNEWVAKH